MKLNSSWKYGYELCEEGLRGFELFDLLQGGVSAKTETGKKIVDKDTLEKKPQYTLEERRNQIALAAGPPGDILTGGGELSQSLSTYEDGSIEDVFPHLFAIDPIIPDGCKAVRFTLPNDEKERAKRIREAKGWLFKIEDVNEFAKKHGHSPIGEVEEADQRAVTVPQQPINMSDSTDSVVIEGSQDPNSGSSAQSSQSGTQSIYEDSPAFMNYFKRIGESWEIQYEGKRTIIRDLTGIRYITYLLNPGVRGKSVPCLDLCHFYSPIEAKTMSGGQAASEGLHDEFSGVTEELDPEEREKQGEYLRELIKEREEAENDAIRRECENEINEVVRKLKGKPEKIANINAVKAQSSIRRALDTAYKRIEKEIPALSNHFRDHIKPDGDYDYKYTASVSWKIIS